MENEIYFSPQIETMEIEDNGCLCLSAGQNTLEDRIEDTYEW